MLLTFSSLFCSIDGGVNSGKSGDQMS